MVFNVRGNAFRLIAAIHLNKQRVYVLRLLSRAEYFPAKDARTKKRYRTLWSKTFVDPAFGTA